MSELGKRLIKGLEEFLDKLKSGEEIEVTEVERFETSDGPMHVRKKKTLKKDEDEI